jgi:hypothetical protein
VEDHPGLGAERQEQVPGAGIGGLPALLARAGQVAPRVLRHLIHIAGLGQQQISAARQFDHAVARAAVTGEGEHLPARSQP